MKPPMRQSCDADMEKVVPNFADIEEVDEDEVSELVYEDLAGVLVCVGVSVCVCVCACVHVYVCAVSVCVLACLHMPLTLCGVAPVYDY